MAGKYYQRIDGVDYDPTVLCEPKVHDAAPGFGTQFTGEGEFQKAGTDTENITLDGYAVNGTKITTVKRGYYPTFNKLLWKSNRTGQHSLIRTNESLIISNSKNTVTFYPSDFHNNMIPRELIIVLVGGGGGGGGRGYFKTKKKSDLYAITGGAGGGGGVVVGRLRFFDGYEYFFTVGAGGEYGTPGASDAVSSGETGETGGTTGLYHTKVQADYCLMAAYGGAGGTGGYPSGDYSCTAGTGGNGGSGYVIKNSPHIISGKYVSGGKGNYYNSHNNTAVAELKYTPTTGTGASAQSFCGVNNDGSSYNATVSGAGGFWDTYYSGGCSFGLGVHFVNGSVVYTGDSRVGYGGGGSSGNHLQDGKMGHVQIYY